MKSEPQRFSAVTGYGLIAMIAGVVAYVARVGFDWLMGAGGLVQNWTQGEPVLYRV